LQGEERLVDTDIQLRNQGVMFLAMGRSGRASDGALLIMLKAGVPPPEVHNDVDDGHE
jgi:hypothetical protein